jgi:probable addiction module antidote protein
MNQNEIDRSDWRIADETFDVLCAKHLAKNPKSLKAFKKRTINEYNKTKDIKLLLFHLKVIAIAEHKMTALAKASKLERSSVYKMLDAKGNPSFYSIVNIAQNLGMDFKLSCIL